MQLRVVRRTVRYDDTVRFYTDALGWAVERSWTNGGRGCLIIAAGEARIEILEVGPDAGGTGATTSAAGGSGEDAVSVSDVFVAVQVDDVRRAAQRLAAAGITLEQEPTEQPWGHRNLGVRDPSGLLVVVFEVL